MNELDLVKDVLQAENQALGIFEGNWETARRNAQIYGLEHWTTEEQKKLRNQNRIPYVIDHITRPVNTLLGTQRDTRFDISYYARESSDEVRAEVLNAVWKYYSNINDFPSVESDVFQDGVIGGYGVFCSEKDYRRDYRGDLRVYRVPYDEVLWDTNFRQYDLSDAYWMEQVCFYRRDELKAYYRNRADLIDAAGNDRAFYSGTKRKDLWYKEGMDLIGTRKFYKRDWVKKFVIWQKGTEVPELTPYATEKEAGSVVQDRYQQMLAGMMPPAEFEVIPIDVPIVTKSVVLINGTLEEPHEFERGKFPFDVYFPYFHDGEYWSVIDRLKDPQLFINRMHAQIDNWIGSSAKGLLWLHPQTTAAEEQLIKETFGKTGGVIKTRHQPQLIESRGPAPQLFSEIDRVQASLQESMGGANALGLKETASESGRAVLARQAQAGLDNFVPLDNLRRTKQNLGESIAYILTNELPAERQFRIMGDALSIQAMQAGGILMPSSRPNVGYMEVNTNPKNTIKELQVDIIVDEASHSVTKNQAVLASMVDLAKSQLVTVPPPIEVIVGLADIPNSYKQAWIQEAQRQAGANKEPIAKVSVNYNDTPPEAKLQILNELGLSSSLQAIAAKELLDKPHLTKKEENGSNKGQKR